MTESAPEPAASETEAEKKPKKKAGLKFAAEVVEVQVCAEEGEQTAEENVDGKMMRLPTNMRKKATDAEDGANGFNGFERMTTIAAPKACDDTDIDPNQGLRSKKSCIDMDHLKDSAAVKDRYKQIKQLGEGGFGTVFEVEQLDGDKETLAMKVIPMTKVEDAGAFKKELDIAKKLKHPNIVRLNEFFQDDTNFYLVMEICSDGDLFDKIAEAFNPFAGDNAGIDDALVSPFVWDMLKGVAYLHHYLYAHRDIKPENYMLKVAGNVSELKLIDFGLARSFKEGELMRSKVGTMAYCAPEILFGDTGYNQNCDLWSLGCVFITMLTGVPPFTGHTDNAIMEKVKKAEIGWDTPKWKRRAKQLKEITQSFMNVKPAERPSAASIIKENEWLRTHHIQDSGNGCCVLS